MCSACVLAPAGCLQPLMTTSAHRDFLAAREKTTAYVKTTTDDLHGHSAPHPVFKMLDGYQWVLLLSGHSARHTAQIEEVKASAGYPAK